MIFAGLRTALAISLLVVVAAEFVAAMFVGIVTFGIVGVVMSTIFLEIERAVLPWKLDRP